MTRHVSRWFKLSHHAHSGKLRPHQHTSYIPLAILLLLASVPLGVSTVSAVSPGPQSGYVGLSGTVPSKPPTKGATITSPASGTHFSATPVTIKGTCVAGLLIELFKNDIFAGSTFCGDNGTYGVDIDLMIGQNTVVAKTYDALNQPGPDSPSVVLYYDALPSQSASAQSLYFGGAQLILNTEAAFRGSFPGQSFDMPITILGGTAPYAVNVSWGDSKNNVVSRSTNATFAVAHAYAKAGTHAITIQATDAQGRIAFLTTAAIVNGQPDTSAASASSEGESGPTGALKMILVLWPLYAGAFATVASFWFGERRERHVLKKHGLLLSQ